jgi:hypothetical protein
MRVAPVVREVPVAQAGEKEQDGVLAGAHVADGTRLLAVAREPGGGQLVERHALDPRREEVLADLRSPEQALQGADVLVLT